MLSTHLKPITQSSKNTRYAIALVLLTLLIGPTLIHPSAANSKRIVTISSPSLDAPTNILQQQPIPQEMFSTYFLTGEGFGSKLIVRNQRIDMSVDVTPILLVDRGREISLDPVTIEASRSVTVDLNQALADLGESNVKSGGLVLRYSFPERGPVSATVTINHAADKLSLMSPVMGREEFMSNTQEGVFWLPDKQTDVFVAVQNTSPQSRRVMPTLFIAGRQVQLNEITLASQETSFLNLNDLLSDTADNTSAAIRLVNDGDPGDVMAEGGLVNHAKGFSKRISFMDTSLHFYDMTLRANFLFLGQPPPELGFPPEVSFRAVCAVRNTSAVKVRVHPTVKYLEAGRTRQARLQGLLLDVNEVATLDLLEAQHSGLIPANFRTGTLELVCDGPAGSVIAELTNLDAAGGYVLGSSFSGNPGRGVGGTFWRIDDDWQSIITLTNAAPIEDRVNVELFYEGGSYRLPTMKVPGGGIATINLKELRRSGTPGVDGNALPLFATSGAFCVKGDRELRSAISMERLIFNSQTSECIVIDGTNNHYVTGISGRSGQPSSPVQQDTEATSVQVSVPLITIARWNDGTQSDMTFDATYSSNNNAFTQVSGPSATVFIDMNSLGATAQVRSVLTGYGCSRGSFASVQAILLIGERASAYVNVGIENGRCLWEKTCEGKCSSTHTTNTFNGRCFTFPNGWKQCADLTVAGVCTIYRVICTGIPHPGLCTD